MWFSNVLANTIKKLFGDYIEGLDSISLPTIWSGDISLENLTINKKQLTTPQSPIEVVQGTIRKFSLHIPWMNLKTQPITVKIDGLYLLATRKDFEDIPRSAGESEDQGETVDMDSIYKVKEKGTDIHKEQSYFSRVIKRVMENIQISVTNVHICYQDAKSTPDHIFAIGMTMDTLTVATTDSDWIPLPTNAGETRNEDYNEAEGDQVHKLVTFFNLAVYWDTDMGLGRTVDTNGSDVAPILSVGIPRHKTDKDRADHQYIVEPLSGLLRATIKGSPDFDEDEEPTTPSTIPYVSASFGLKEVDITLQSNQYRDLLNLCSFLRDWDVSLRYVKFRPEVDVKSDPRAWWLFAFRAVRKELRRRSGIHLKWSELAMRRNDRRAYIKIFKKKLLTHRLIRVERDLLNVLEKKLSYEDVVFYRAIAQRELEDEQRKLLTDPLDVYQNSTVGEGVGSVSGFIASLMRWPFQGQAKPQEQALTDEEMRDIFESTKTDPERLLRRYDAAAYYSWAGTLQCSIRLLRVTIAEWIQRDENEPEQVSSVKPLCSLTLTDGDMRASLGEKTASFSVTLGSVVIDDTSTPHTAYTRIVGPSQGTFTSGLQAGGSQPMISMEIVQNPPHSNANYALAASLAPITVVYSSPLLATMARFFTRGDEAALAKLTQTLLEKIHELQQKLYTEIKSVIRTQKTADAAFQLHMPQIIIPESHERDDGPALVIQGGLLKLESEPRKPKSSKMDSEGRDLERIIDTRTRWRSAHAHHDAMQRDLLGAHESHTAHTLHSVTGTQAALDRPAGASASPDQMWYYDAYAASWEGFGVHLIVPVQKNNTNVSSREHASTSQATSVTVATPVSLLEPASCSALLEVCALPYNIDLPQIILCGHISPLKCQVNREHMILLGKIAASLGLLDPVPEDPEAPPSQSGVRVQKRSTMEMFDIMTDVKDFIKTRKHTHEKLQSCVLMQGQITLPLITGIFGYKEGGELRIVASRVAVGAVTGVYRMDTELRVYEMSVVDSNVGELIKFSHPVNPITPSDVFAKEGGADAGGDNEPKIESIDDDEEGNEAEQSGNAKRSEDGGDLYNPISEGIKSDTGHPTDHETSRVVVDAAPLAPFLTCRIRNVARSSLEYDYTDYFLDTTLGPCEIAVHQDVIVSCLKVYYYAMAEACKCKTKPTDEKPPKHKKKPHEPRRSYRDDVLSPGAGEEVWDIKSNVKLTCEKLGIKLQRRSGDVALFEMSGLGVEGEAQGKAIDFRVSISAMSIQDLTPEGVRYRPVLESLGRGNGLHFPPIALTPREKAVTLRPHEWMAIRLVSFDDTRASWPGYHYALAVHSAPFRFVFLMQFVNTLRRFADRITRKMTKYDLHLNRAKQTGDVSHNGDYSYHDDDLLMHEQQKDAKESPRVKIDAVIAAPQIIIPRSARTDEVVVMHLQQVSIHNFFNVDKEGVNVGNVNNVNAAQELKMMNIEHTIIQLAGCVPHSATLSIDRSTHTHTRPLAEKPLDLKIHFTRNLEAGNIDPVKMNLSTRVMPILLTRAQFNNLLLMIRHNINESVVGPPPSATTPMQPPANMSEGDAEKLKEQQQKWVTFELVLSLDAVLLHLFDEKSDPFPFGHLGLEHVTLKAKMFSDNDTTMQILTHSLVLSSAVGGRGSELREIFRTEYSDPLTDQFELLDYRADATGVQTIKLSVDSPRIYLVLARATQVINFITPADDPDVPPPQPSVNSISSWTPVNTLTVSMINAKMLLMSDFTKPFDDNAMIVCADMSITWQASADNCQKLTIKVRGMRMGMKRVNGPPLVEDVYEMLRREDESSFGAAPPKKADKVETGVTHELERERGLTNRRKQAQEQLAIAKQELAQALAGPIHDLGDQFIRPINIEVQANLVPTGEPVPSNVVLIHVDALEMVLKSRTINAMAHIAASVNEALASFSSPDSRPPAPPTRPPRVEYASAVESGPVSESEVMAVASTQTLIPPVAVDMGGPPYQIIINTRGFRMSFVDDLTTEKGRLNSPLAALKSDSCVAKINLSGGQTNIRLDTILEACYFNPYLAVWEPFLEPWQCRVLMQTAPYSMIEITSPDHLNVNVTPALIEEVTKTLMPWSNVALANVTQNATSQTQSNSAAQDRTGEPPSPPPSSANGDDNKNKVAHWRGKGTGHSAGKNMCYSPFWVTNLVGVSLTYRVERTGGGAIGGWQRLDPHESAPVSITEMSLLDMDQFALSRLVLVVLLDLPASNQLIRADTSLYVPLHRVRKYEYEVQIGSTQEQPSLTEDIEPESNHNTPTRVHIVCDVRAQYGSKAVIIQSPVVIENHTSLDIEIGLDIPPVTSHPGRTKHVHPASTRPRPLVPLATLPANSERAPLPLTHISTAKLRLRPVQHVNTKVPGPDIIQVPPLDMPAGPSEHSVRTVVGVVPSDTPAQDYGWSVNVVDFWSMDVGGDTIVRCGPDFCCRVVVHRKSPNMVVKICPVVEVYNYLPCQLYYNLIPSRPPKPLMTAAQIEDGEARTRRKGRTMYEGAIAPESMESMTNVFLESSFSLAISIPSQEEGNTDRVAFSKPINFQKGANEDLHIFKVNPFPSRKGSLRINARFKNYKGTFRLEIFNQIWVANQTGLPLYILQSQASNMFAKPEPIYLRSSDTNSVSFATCPPTMVSFPQLDVARNKVGLSIASSQRISNPSESFSLSAIGYRGVTVVNQSNPEDATEECNRAYHIGVSIDLASNKRTKLVKLAPRYVLVNDGSKPMLVGQPGTNHVIRVGAGERVPMLYWIHHANCPQILRMSLDDETAQSAWSSSFDIKTVGELTLKMQRPITIQGYSSLNYFRVHKVLIDSTIYVIFSPSAKAPYYIDNQTDMTLNINQAGLDTIERIPPKSMIPYAWDQPLHEHKLEVAAEGTRFKAVYRLDKLKVYPTRKVECGEVVVDVAASIVPEESSRILRLANFNRQPPHAPTEEVVSQQFRLNLHAVGVSVISDISHIPHEILYASLEDIYVNFSNSDLFQKLEVKLGNLQVDNQLAQVKNYQFPVLLSSVKGDPSKPFFHLSFVNSNTVTSRSTMHIHYLSTLMQEVDIKLEERLIYRLMDFSNILGFSDQRDHPTLKEGSLHDEKQFESSTTLLNIEALRKQSDNRMYLELLVINPLKVNLSFQVSHMGLNKKDKETPLVEFARNLGFTIVSFDAPLRLNALTLRHAFGSMSDIQQPLMKHYIQQGIREAYKVVGSFDIIGNPVNLLRDLGTGFKDFFVEPSRGITHSPEEFRAGLAKGSTSLIKHTVYAIANSATSITGTAARGFAAMSMDKDYLSERDRILREQPTNFGQGVTQGAKGLRAGVKYGVSGVVMLPYQGAKQEGALGLAKGISKGLAGAVLKPTAGAVDLVALSSQSVRNMADPSAKLERKRTPRHFPCDGTLAEYNANKAYGGYLMQALFKHDTRPTSGSSIPSKGEMDYLSPDSDSLSPSSTKTVTVTSSPFHQLDESYAFHIIWRNSTTLLFTNRRLACFADPKAIRKRWDVLLANIANVRLADKSVKLRLNHPVHKNRYKMNKAGKLRIKCNDSTARQYIFHTLLRLLESSKPNSQVDAGTQAAARADSAWAAEGAARS